MATPKDYIKENEWYITASKLKCYLKNPEEYYLKYVQKIKIEQTGRHFILWDSFDDLVTYRIQRWSNKEYEYERNPVISLFVWEQAVPKHNESTGEDQIWIKKRLEKYYVDTGRLKDDLVKKLCNMPMHMRWWYSDFALRAMRKNDLRDLFYQCTEHKRIRLTYGEAKIIFGMYTEVLRQEKMDMFGRYGVQHLIETDFQWTPIRGKLDRLVFYDKSWDRYLPSEVDEFIAIEWRASRLQTVEENDIKAYNRDWKTSWRIDTFEYDMEETFDYVMSMAFYFALVKAKYGVLCDSILDVLSKKDPHGSIVYRLHRGLLMRKLEQKVIPWLISLARAYETNTRDPVDPLTGQPVSRYEMMKSPYYSLMQWSIQKTTVDSY